MTKPTPKTSITGRFFENDKQVQAHESAADYAQERSQDFSARVATDVAVAARKVLSNYMHVSTEKLVREIGELVLKRAYASCYEGTYKSSFSNKYDGLVRDERRQKAEARKQAKQEEWRAAMRQECAEMFSSEAHSS